MADLPLPAPKTPAAAVAAIVLAIALSAVFLIYVQYTEARITSLEDSLYKLEHPPAPTPNAKRQAKASAKTDGA